MSLKKEFVTYWSIEAMTPSSLRVRDLLFFDVTKMGSKKDNTRVTAVIPDDIKFLDLLVFDGKKTRVTIEVVE